MISRAHRHGAAHTIMTTAFAALLTLAGATAAQADEIPDHDPNGDQWIVANGETTMDLEAVGDLSESRVYVRVDRTSGVVTELTGAFPCTDAEIAFLEVLAAGGLDADPQHWEAVSEEWDQDGTSVLELAHLGDQGLELAGGRVRLSSRDGWLHTIRGPLTGALPSVELGPVTPQDWQETLGPGYEISPIQLHLPDAPWTDMAVLAEQPVAVMIATAAEERLYLNTSGNVVHRLVLGNPAPHTALAYFHSECRTTQCITDAVNHVLHYPSLSTVQNVLSTRLVFGAHDGVDVVTAILEDYDPSADLMVTQEHLSRTFDRLGVAPAVWVDLANIAHMIWVELVSLQPPANPGYVILPQYRTFGWSLASLSSTDVDEYLLGDTARYRGSNREPKDYHFKHYPIALEIMRRMHDHHPYLSSDPVTAVARFVEFAADNFVHQSSRWPGNGPAVYVSRYAFDGIHDADKSEAYQRRISGCGIPSYVSPLLARSVNIPGAYYLPLFQVGHPPCRCGHAFAYFPSIQFIVHGDAVVGSNNGLGPMGETLMWPMGWIAGQSQNDLYQAAYIYLRRAKDDLQAYYGIDLNRGGAMLYRVPDQARRFTSGMDDNWVGRVHPHADLTYLYDRFNHLDPQLVYSSKFKAHFIEVDTFKYRLLEDVAAYWPMDHDRLGAGQVSDRTVHHLHATLTGSGTAVSDEPVAKKGEGIRFHGGQYAVAPDLPALRHSSEELSLSLWVRPQSSATGQVHAGTLFRRTLSSSGAVVYSLELEATGHLRFRVKPGLTASEVAVSSQSAITPSAYHHVVVTFEKNAEIALYVNGGREAATSVTGELPMSQGTTSGEEYDFAVYPATTVFGADGFTGVLDEILVYFPALSQADVTDLFASYGP